jgi:micrococcal nuclease
MYTYKIKLDRVVDGDTIDAYIDLGFDVSVKKRIRFMGINTPESRTRDLEEKAKGLAAKDRVKQLLEGADVIQLESHGVGKYGRCLGELSIDVVDGKQGLTLVNVNELLIKEGHAVEYHGGKR